MLHTLLSKKLYILFVFCALTITLSAQKEAFTPQEKELLEAVSRKNRVEAIRLLTEEIDVNITDDYGQSLLMFAIRYRDKGLADILLKKGANPNYRINQKAEYGSGKSAIKMLMLKDLSVFDYAIGTRDISMVDFLIDAGAKLDIQNKDINSAVSTASNDNNVMMVRYLLSKGAKVSDETRYSLVVGHILGEADPFYGVTKINKNTDFSLVKIWDDYGTPLDDEKLVSSRLLHKERDKKNVINYMAAYREWRELKAALPEETIEPLPIPVSDTMDEFEMDRLIAEAQERSQIRKEEQDNISLEETEASQKTMIIFVSLVSAIFVLYILYKYSRSFWSALFQAKTAPPAPTPNNNARPNVRPVRKPLRNNKPIPIITIPTPDQPSKRKGKKRRVTKMLEVSEKGWTKDDTVGIEVFFLTIEDMINPIPLKNEHEKAVREMIAYLRKLEKLSDSKIANLMGKKGFAQELDSLWKSIDPNNVRDIYKRSLYILVEDYSKRDKRVNVFLYKRRWIK